MARVRMLRRLLPVLFAGAFSAGCVSTTLQLAANHPARPNSPSGLSGEPAAVLEPSAALYQDAGGGIASPAPDGTRANPFAGRGVIQQVREGELVIDHEAIPGFMGAMTMAYPLTDDVDVAALEAGDTVAFRIEIPESGGYRIFAVEAIGLGGGR